MNGVSMVMAKLLADVFSTALHSATYLLHVFNTITSFLSKAVRKMQPGLPLLVLAAGSTPREHLNSHRLPTASTRREISLCTVHAEKLTSLVSRRRGAAGKRVGHALEFRSLLSQQLPAP